MNAEIYVNGELVGRGADGMLAALPKMLGGEVEIEEEATLPGDVDVPDEIEERLKRERRAGEDEEELEE